MIAALRRAGSFTIGALVGAAWSGFVVGLLVGLGALDRHGGLHTDRLERISRGLRAGSVSVLQIIDR